MLLKFKKDINYHKNLFRDFCTLSFAFFLMALFLSDNKELFAQGSKAGQGMPAKKIAPRGKAKPASKPVSSKKSKPAKPTKPGKRDTAPGGQKKDLKIKQKKETPEVVEKKETEEEKKEREKREKRIKKLLDIFKFGTSKERRGALERVLKIKNPKEIEKLKPGLKSIFKDRNNKLLLRKVIEVVGILKLKDFVPEVIKSVEDDNREVRRTAIDTIDKLKAKEGGDVIFQFFRKQDLSINDNSTLSAIEALGNLGNQKFTSYILNTLRNEYPDVKASTAQKKKEPALAKNSPGQDKNLKEKPGSIKENTGEENQKARDNKSGEKVSTEKKSEKNSNIEKSKVAPPQIKKESSHDKLFWKKDTDQKLSVTIAGRIFLKIGDMKYTGAGPFLASMAEASFRYDEIEEDRDDGKKIAKNREKGSVFVAKGIQGYIVNSLGKLGYADSRDLLKEKVKRIEGYISDDRKKKYLMLYLQCLAALVRLGDQSVSKILVRSLRDDSPGIRLRSAILIAELRPEESIDMLKFRAMHDSHPKVRFECLKALMEIVEPGSTNSGRIKGKDSSSDAKKKAMKSLVEFMDYEKNPNVRESYLGYIGKNIVRDEIEEVLVKVFEKRIQRFLSRNAQEGLVRAISGIVRSKLKKNKTKKGKAYDLLQKIKISKNHRYAARLASRTIKQLDRLKEDLGAKEKIKAPKTNKIDKKINSNKQVTPSKKKIKVTP